MARILIMDDNAEVRLALRRLLQSHGHEVFEAPNAAEGAKLYHQALPDLVITDLLMPERDGIEALIELRTKYPQVKIIIISGHAYTFLPLAQDLGAHRTILKPFKNPDVIAAVNDLLGQNP